MLDLQALLGPMVSMIVPGLFDPAEQVTYSVMSVSKPNNGLMLEFWWPATVVEKLKHISIAVSKVFGERFGAGDPGAGGFDMGLDAGADMDEDFNPFEDDSGGGLDLDFGDVGDPSLDQGDGEAPEGDSP